MGQRASKEIQPEGEKMVEEPAKSLPSPIRHYHSLTDGRLMAYYTFTSKEPQQKPEDQHPILYFHGFPGSGVEGALCAEAADMFGGKLYGIDRPGFGSSEPLVSQNSKTDPDAYVQGFIDEVWDFVQSQKWKSFSVIGVSGGGPYALAMLERYLSMMTADDETVVDDNSSKTSDKSSVVAIPKLMAVCVVAGIACGAGTEGMLDVNKKLLETVMAGGYWGQLFLKWNFAMQSFMVSYLPTSWLISLSKSVWKSLPVPDLHILQTQPAVVDTMMEDLKESFRQGHRHAYLESQVLFRQRQGFESSLQEKWAAGEKAVLPMVTIFQGGMDKNVPPSHSRFVHEHIFGSKLATLREYPSLGHMSLIVNKADEYVLSAVPV